MCLSAPASFLVGVALLPAGYYCTRVAIRHSKSRPTGPWTSGMGMQVRQHSRSCRNVSAV